MMNRSLFQKHERDIANLFSGRLTKGSGCTPYDKGDVSCGSAEDDIRMTVECKCTQADSYRVSFAVWDKINKQARQRSATPVLAVRLCDEFGRTVKDYIVVPEIWSDTPLGVRAKSFVLTRNGVVEAQERWVSNGSLSYELKVYEPEEFVKRWLNA